MHDICSFGFKLLKYRLKGENMTTRDKNIVSACKDIERLIKKAKKDMKDGHLNYSEFYLDYCMKITGKIKRSLWRNKKNKIEIPIHLEKSGNLRNFNFTLIPDF